MWPRIDEGLTVANAADERCNETGIAMIGFSAIACLESERLSPHNARSELPRVDGMLS